MQLDDVMVLMPVLMAPCGRPPVGELYSVVLGGGAGSDGLPSLHAAFDVSHEVTEVGR